MRIPFASMLVLLGCGTPSSPGTSITRPAGDGTTLGEATARSGCAFESLDALCRSLRATFRTTDEAWVSDDCARGPAQTRTGPFAEVLLLGIRNGYERAGDAAGRPHALLGSSVDEPAGHEGATQVLLAARVGPAWFPIHLFQGILDDEEANRIAFSLSDDGSALEWTSEERSGAPEDASGYGVVRRALAFVDRGIPLLAGQAEIERWQSEVDLACTRACNAEPRPPAYPGCERRCASRAHARRSWARAGANVAIGATEIERSGEHAETIELPAASAETLALDPARAQRLCAFTPVVLATPLASPRTDGESIAARERARSLVASGSVHEVPGAAAAVDPGAERSIVAIDRQLGGSCSGGACTTNLDYRTVEGTMPEQGLSFVEAERGPMAGCDAAILPAEGAPATLVEVAPARSREAFGCGFVGWDGERERSYVVLRVLGP